MTGAVPSGSLNGSKTQVPKSSKRTKLAQALPLNKVKQVMMENKQPASVAGSKVKRTAFAAIDNTLNVPSVTVALSEHQKSPSSKERRDSKSTYLKLNARITTGDDHLSLKANR